MLFAFTMSRKQEEERKSTTIHRGKSAMRARTPMSAMGSRLHDVMIMRGITQARGLAKLLGVRPATVNRWLHKSDVKFDCQTMLDMTDRLHCNVRWILNGTETPEPRQVVTEAESELLSIVRKVDPDAMRRIVQFAKLTAADYLKRAGDLNQPS